MRPVLHVITDETIQTSFTHTELAERVSANGADFIQYREKRAFDTKSLCSVAASMLKVCAQSKQSQLVVNDRVDIAFAVGAHSIHLGKNDLPVSVAREILGPDAFIGGTANSMDEAMLCSTRSVDYLGVGPVFGTTSKLNPASNLGLANLAQICSNSPLPVIAIGNIRLENVHEVIENGAAGVAVLSSIVGSEDPGQATLEFVRALEKC